MNEKKLKKRYKQNKTRRAIIAIALLVLFVLYFFSLPKELFNTPYSTVVSDRNNELLGARIADDGQWRFPPSHSVPEKFKKALINFEDKYYYSHWGFNPVSLFRAFYLNIKKQRIVSGGSTITMQTIRLSRNKPRSISEKLKEIILATRMEFRYSKEEILALYASHAPFGGNIVGLEAASWRYFAHTAEDLSWAEAATLAVLPNAPAMIHFQKNRSKLIYKRNALLTRLYEKGIINETDYQLALSEELPKSIQPLPVSAPHLVDYFFKNQKGEKRQTTIEAQNQEKVEGILGRWNDKFKTQGIKNIAAIVIDINLSEVIAYCGNTKNKAAEKSIGEDVDIIRSMRSPGSLLKPLLYYAALEDGLILPQSLLPDIPMKFGTFKPQNFNLHFDGAVPADKVIARSLNIPCVHLLHQYGLQKFYSFLKKVNFSSLNRPAEHYGLSLVLGGAEGSLWDISSIYTDMARSLKQLPREKLRLTQQDNKEKKLKELYHPGIVWQTFEAMKYVNRPGSIDWEAFPSIQTVSWKTGTSFGFRDGWAIGITPKFVVGVWVGNATGEGKPGLTGTQTAAPVMFEILNSLPASKWFEPVYKEMIDAEVCTLSGDLKGRFCEETKTIPVSVKGTQGTTCRFHINIHVTADEKYRVYESCAQELGIIQKPWFVLPPAWAWYYKQHNTTYKALPPLLSGCQTDNFLPMQFIYPTSNFAHIKRSLQLDGKKGEITFELAHNNKEAIVFWHIDEEYITQTSDFHKISTPLEAGEHNITVVDNSGNTLSLNVVVE